MGLGDLPVVINNPVGIVLDNKNYGDAKYREWTLIVAMFKISKSEFESYHTL